MSPALFNDWLMSGALAGLVVIGLVGVAGAELIALRSYWHAQTDVETDTAAPGPDVLLGLPEGGEHPALEGKLQRARRTEGIR